MIEFVPGLFVSPGTTFLFTQGIQERRIYPATIVEWNF